MNDKRYTEETLIDRLEANHRDWLRRGGIVDLSFRNQPPAFEMDMQRSIEAARNNSNS